MEMKFCFLCGMPIDDSNRMAGDYCKYCVQPDGRLKPKEEVMHGIGSG